MSSFADLHASLQKPRPKALDTDDRRRKLESEYVKNSKEARRRDHRHCRICGTHHQLETHHLVPRSLVGKALRNALSNLITLCRECHELVTRHVMKLTPNDAQKGANGTVKVLRYQDEEKGYVVAMEAA